MAKLEDVGITGIKGLIFDCYNTLIDIDTDENGPDTYAPICRWLIYQGVKISADELEREYKRGVNEYLASRWEKYPEVRVEQVFTKICQAHALWDIDEDAVGVETARTFRSASLRKLKAFPQSIKLLKNLEEYPKAIVSNGQSAFSELEMRYLGIYDMFNIVIFSSDFGHKKPDPRIFLEATRTLGLEPEEMLCIGDNFDNDIVPAVKLGMKAMHIEEAWRIFGTI